MNINKFFNDSLAALNDTTGANNVNEWRKKLVAALTVIGDAAGLTTTASAAELNYLDITTLGTGAASKAVVLDASGDYTFPATATLVHPSGATDTHASGSTLNVAGTFQIGGVTVGATAAEIDKAADVSSYVSTLTATGAIPATARYVELNHATVVIAATYTVVPNSILIIKDTSATGTVAHTVTLSGGTFNGTNTVATLDARDEFLMVHFDSAGRGQVIANVGSVGLS